MKVFLTGATGILGTDIMNHFQSFNHEVIGFGSSDINVSKFSDVKSKVKDFNPDVIIHSAAMTNVDLCEDEKTDAIAINILGSQNMAMAARYVNAKIVYISSCGVYGNEKDTAYTELDNTHPLNFHHYTKLEGEKKVKEHHNDFLIIRPGWLFGGNSQHKKNFVEARRREALNNAVLKSAGDKFGSPTYTYDVARQVLTLLSAEICGTFNVVNEGCASRYDYVSKIVECFGINSLVESANSQLFPRKAVMPDNECLENFFLKLQNINSMRNWEDALIEYIKINY